MKNWVKSNKFIVFFLVKQFQKIYEIYKFVFYAIRDELLIAK